MKRKIMLIAIVLLTTHFTYSQEVPTKPRIALLGTFHFAGSTDMMSLKVNDLKGEKRQAEIEEVVEAIVRYRPTKLMLEYPYGNGSLDSLYQLYRKGNYELRINERQQIGFQVAKALGHEHIYTADHHLDLPFNELNQYLQETGQMHVMDSFMAYIKENAIDVMQEAYDRMDLSDFFRFINQDKFDVANKNAYLEYMNHLGDDESPVGINLNTTWWERNFRIMRNIDVQTAPGDRVFVLFGQGHTAILKDYYRERSDIEYVDILEYLK